MSQVDWTGAVCDNPWIDPNIFFSPNTIREAKDICSTCPLIAKCAAYALDPEENIVDGVYGGLSEQDRKELRAQKRRASRRGIKNRRH